MKTVESDQLGGRLPGVRQVLCVKRMSIEKKTGKESLGVRYFVTSLSKEEAGSGALLRYVRGHWGVEVSHWERDTYPWQEDRYRYKKPRIAQNVSLLSCMIQTLIILSGMPSLSVAMESFVDNRQLAIYFILNQRLMKRQT